MNLAPADRLSLSQTPYFMWIVSAINMAFAGLFTWIFSNNVEDWWRWILMTSFYLALILTLYMAKQEHLMLYNDTKYQSYLIEKRLICIKSRHRFLVNQITTIKLREEGKSSRTFYLDIFLVDGRSFSIFKSGLRQKAVEKMIRIRKFVEDHFANNEEQFIS